MVAELISTSMMRSRLQAMAPGADIAQAGRAVGDQVHQPRQVLRRADVGDAHGQELGAAVAVVLERGLVDLEKGERVEVVDPHRRRVLVEQEAEARLFLDAGGRPRLARRRAADGLAQMEVADGERGEIGKLRQDKRVLRGEIALRLVGQVDQPGGLAAGVAERSGEAAAQGRAVIDRVAGARPVRVLFELSLRQPQRAVAARHETTKARVVRRGVATAPAGVFVRERDMVDRLGRPAVGREMDGGLMRADDGAGFLGGDLNRFRQRRRGREARGGLRQGGKPAVCHAGSFCLRCADRATRQDGRGRRGS